MPELPDILAYQSALATRLVGQSLLAIRLGSPFVLRSVAPPLSACQGRDVVGIHRIGKRLILDLQGDLHLALHLMIAGRLKWLPAGAKLPGKLGLCAFDFPNGTLLLTEASGKKRASLHVIQGEPALAALHRGGVDVLHGSLADFGAALRRENHTLKRALTDPRLIDGVGNAYSDEILHRARLSPMQLTAKLTDAQVQQLHTAAQAVLGEWIARLDPHKGADFPKNVTAFRPEMAVHGRFGQPCPDCGTAVQRIVHGEQECNYCPRCQTAGRLLADRALSKLLHGDWPKRIEDLEESGVFAAPPQRSFSP